MKKKNLIYIPFFLFVFLFIIAFRPIINPSLDDCTKIVGTLSTITIQDKTLDIFFKIEGDPVEYYINRGMTKIGLSDILTTSKGQKITIYPVKHWTPLNISQSIQHIARVEFESKIIYDETAS